MNGEDYESNFEIHEMLLLVDRNHHQHHYHHLYLVLNEMLGVMIVLVDQNVDAMVVALVDVDDDEVGVVEAKKADVYENHPVVLLHYCDRLLFG